jgi:hemerythrin
MKKWSEQFTMGVADLDQDHRQLMRVAEMIAERVDHPETDPKQWPFLVREGLKYMGGYYESHVHKEEAYMREIGYPHYEAHKALHDELERTVTQYISSQIEGGHCELDDVLELLGATYGWQMIHIAMDDMAIVGKGVMALPPEEEVTEEAITREIDTMLYSLMGLDAHARIINDHYDGEGVNSAVCQKIVYNINGTDVTIIFGMERTLLLHAIEALWADKKLDKSIDKAHMVLLQWCLTSLTVGFWRSMIARFTHDQPCVLKEVYPLDNKDSRQMMRSIVPSHSTLYQTNQGRFFVASDH